MQNPANLYAIQGSSEPVMQTDGEQPNEECGNENMDYSQMVASVQLKTETDDVFMSETELKQTLEELKKEFMMPQLPVEKFRRHSDSDHFMVPKAGPAKKCTALTDQLRRKALTQRRTYRLASDPGGDPFCDIPEDSLIESDDIPIDDGNQGDSSTFFQPNQDQQMQQFSNPTPPPSVTIFPPSQMALSGSNQMESHHQQQATTSPQTHGFVPIQTEPISAPTTPTTQPHASFFQVDQMAAPTTPTQTHVGFFEAPPTQHQEPVSNPCTPTQPNVGFFQSQHHHGHVSMPSTPTQQNASFFPSTHQPHPEQFSNPSTPTQPHASFTSQDHQQQSQPQANEMYYQQEAPHLQGQFSVPSTPTQSHASFFQNGQHQMSAPNTPTAPQTPVSMFSYSSHDAATSASTYNHLPLHDAYDHNSFQFSKPNDMCKDDSNLNQSDDVFTDSFTSALDDEAFIGNTASTVNQFMNCNSSDNGSAMHHPQLPAISISHSVFDSMNSSSAQTSRNMDTNSVVSAAMQICSKSSPGSAPNNVLLTIPKSAQNNNNDSSDDVFISPSSLPTSPIRMKRKHRPEVSAIPSM